MLCPLRKFRFFGYLVLPLILSSSFTATTQAKPVDNLPVDKGDNFQRFDLSDFLIILSDDSQGAGKIQVLSPHVRLPFWRGTRRAAGNTAENELLANVMWVSETGKEQHISCGVLDLVNKRFFPLFLSGSKPGKKPDSCMIYEANDNMIVGQMNSEEGVYFPVFCPAGFSTTLPYDGCKKQAAFMPDGEANDMSIPFKIEQGFGSENQDNVIQGVVLKQINDQLYDFNPHRQIFWEKSSDGDYKPMERNITGKAIPYYGGTQVSTQTSFYSLVNYTTPIQISMVAFGLTNTTSQTVLNDRMLLTAYDQSKMIIMDKNPLFYLTDKPTAVPFPRGQLLDLLRFPYVEYLDPNSNVPQGCFSYHPKESDVVEFQNCGVEGSRVVLPPPEPDTPPIVMVTSDYYRKEWNIANSKTNGFTDDELLRLEHIADDGTQYGVIHPDRTSYTGSVIYRYHPGSLKNQ